MHLARREAAIAGKFILATRLTMNLGNCELTPTAAALNGTLAPGRAVLNLRPAL